MAPSFYCLDGQILRLFYVKAKKVLARYREADLPLARLWLRSWKARGWRTGISFTQGISFRTINFGLPRRGSDPGKFKTKRFGARGWETAPLVCFPDSATEEQVLACGRRI